MMIAFARALCLTAFVSLLSAPAGTAWAQMTVPVEELAGRTHFHGIAVDPAAPNRVYLATHHGLYEAGPSGMARQVSIQADDFMGFVPHPRDRSLLYASGHPQGGGNTGVIVSRDGGRTWTKIADGAGGPVDFHQMDISKADPRVLYGVYRVLQVSRDSGITWRSVGSPPAGLIDLAASALDAESLYAATQGGLLWSVDGGRVWAPVRGLPPRTATMVHVGINGEVWAYVLDVGLMKASEPATLWQPVGPPLAGAAITHLAAAGDGTTLYAVSIDLQTRAERVIVSRDRGLSWMPL